jgi:LDH2 family malate/lactate/ureidoglycolate dehydrogenase
VSTGEASRAAPAPSLRVDAGALTAWVEEVLVLAGVAGAAAAATAEGLVDANRRGLDSHGVVLLDMYLPRLRDGVINGRAEPSVSVDAPAAVLIDGDGGLGHYVGGYALEVVCERARACGVALALVRRSTHFGAASWYSNRAAERGFVSLVLSNGGPCMAPLGGRAPILGNNPVALAAPPAPGSPLPSLDFATSVVAWGRVADAARTGQSIPPAWAMGPDGLPTADPAVALEGALLPAGDYKGFGLAFMTDVLAACVAGSPISPAIVSDGSVVESVGHCLIAIDVDRFCERAAYEESLGRLVEAVHGAPRASGADPFMIPGEREARAARERASSIPLAPATVALLEPWADAFGVPLPAEGDGTAHHCAAKGRT